MKHQYLKNVATLKLNQNLCTGCGKCIEVCPHQVFAIINSKASIINKDRCIELNPLNWTVKRKYPLW